MTKRTERISRTIALVNQLDGEWRQSTAGHDDPQKFLPFMPFPWTDFVALMAEALPEAEGDRFLEIGCGPGSRMLLAEEIFGFDVEGIERVPEYVKAAQDRGVPVTEADALGWDGYGRYDIIFFNRAFADVHLQERLEQEVWTGMKPGAIVIGVNLIAPPPAAWYLILDDREVRRWICQKLADDYIPVAKMPW